MPDRISRSRARRPQDPAREPVRGAVAARPEPDETSRGPWASLIRDHLQRAAAESLRMPPSGALSHVTAAIIHGFPLRTVRLRSSPVHVSVPSQADRRRHSGLASHPLPRDMGRIRSVRGFVVTDAVDTWCALSAILSVDELVAIGDHLVRRQDPDATMARLRGAVRGYAGRHGAKRLRIALELVRPRTDSSKETELRLEILRAGLPEPIVNVPVQDAQGRHIKLGDLVYEKERILVEYDGEQHRTDDAQYAKDARDLERLVNSGWLVIRIRNGEMPAAAKRVAAALAARRSV